MKHILTIVLLLCGLVYLNAQPKIEFNKTTHDYGQVKEDGGLAETQFEFKNTGTEPLILNNVKATCGCTTPEWTKDPVAPGKTGVIKVSYNPQNRPGAFNKNVNVYSNTQPSVTVLTIQGDVTPKQKSMEEEFPKEIGQLRWRTNFLSLGTMLNTQKKSEQLEFINTGTTAVKLEANRLPNHIVVTFEPQTVEPGKKGFMKVTYDASKNPSFGYISDRIFFLVNGINDNTYSVGVSLTINEDFTKLTPDELAKAPKASFDVSTFDFGVIKQDEKVNTVYKLTNNGKSDLILRNVKTTCGCTAVKHENLVKPGQTIDLKVEFNSRGKSGRQNKSITVITNDPVNSTISLRLTGTVEGPVEKSGN